MVPKLCSCGTLMLCKLDQGVLPLKSSNGGLFRIRISIITTNIFSASKLFLIQVMA